MITDSASASGESGSLSKEEQSESRFIFTFIQVFTRKAFTATLKVRVSPSSPSACVKPTPIRNLCMLRRYHFHLQFIHAKSRSTIDRVKRHLTQQPFKSLTVITTSTERFKSAVEIDCDYTFSVESKFTGRPPKMPIDLYQVPASGPCRAVIMTAQHIGVELNKKNVDLFAGEQMKPEYLQMNPQHCVPTIDDGGFYLWESRAIQTYLVNKYAPDSPIYPKDPKERAVVDRMLYFDIGTLYKAESEYLYPQLFKGQPADPEKEENFKKTLALLEGFLENTSYVAGNHITLADFSILASLTFAELAEYNFEPYPKISAWMQKLKSEVPNYKEINEVPLNQFKEFLKSKK